MTERSLASDRRACLGIFLAAFFFYMLTSSRERPWADATAVWEVADSIVESGSVTVATRWPYNAPPGRDGKFYGTNPLVNSLVHLPAAAVRQVITKKWPQSESSTWPFACHVAPAALGALTCVLFFGLCREHGASLRIASLSTLALGAGTIVWVYARYPYSEILQVAFFTGAFLQLVRVIKDPSGRQARWLGLWTALLVSAKTVYVVALPGAALFVAWRLRRDPRALVRVLAWTAAMMVPAVAMYLFYNWLRWGAPLNDGYGPAGPAFLRGNLANGMWGFLLSPGKSLFLYSLPLVVALFGLGALAGRHAQTAILAVITVVPVLAVSARLPYWHGDYAWGPRYAVFATPVLLLPLCFVLQRVAETQERVRRRLATAAIVATMVLGFWVTVLGNAFHWDHWIRITREARTAWLGAANRAGATTPDRGGICDSCFEDLHQLHWIPHFQPIRGHLWLFRHVVAEHDWVVAEKDAPWHPETSLRLGIRDSSQRARIDWWVMDYKRHKTAAAVLFLVMGLGMGAGVWSWTGRSWGLTGPRPRPVAPG